MNLTVPMEGGEAVIEYRIVNPVEGGTISAEPTENWLGGFNYDTPGRIVFNVDENTADEDRSSIVTLTYTYDENESVTAQLNVIQASYDYVIDCTFMSGTYYGSQYGLNGEYNYYTILSDMEYNDGAMDGGSYYAFDLYTASAPENPDNPLPAAGTYVLGEQGATADMTFAPDHTQALRTSVDGEVDFNAGLASAVYTPSVDPVNPAPGEYVTGYLDGDYLMGTNYMETLEGLIVGCAPAVSGDLSITNNGDDTYTISFAFTDDLGHVWDGEWTGVLDFSNRSYAPERTFCRKSGEVSVSENYMSPYKADNVRVINKMLRRAERG